jgi:hypothetical protein
MDSCAPVCERRLEISHARGCVTRPENVPTAINLNKQCACNKQNWTKTKCWWASFFKAAIIFLLCFELLCFSVHICHSRYDKTNKLYKVTSVTGHILISHTCA